MTYVLSLSGTFRTTVPGTITALPSSGDLGMLTVVCGNTEICMEYFGGLEGTYLALLRVQGKVYWRRICLD